MNSDDFEQELRRQHMRQIPADWRGPILGACIRGAAVAEEARVPAWRLLLARFPVAWGAIAALWVVLISVNALLGPNMDSSLILESSVPVVAERPMYFNYKGFAQGGSDTRGYAK